MPDMKVLMIPDVDLPGNEEVSTPIETFLAEFAADARGFANESSSLERALQLATPYLSLAN